MFRLVALRPALATPVQALFSTSTVAFAAAGLTRASVEERVLEVVRNTPKIDETKVSNLLLCGGGFWFSTFG